MGSAASTTIQITDTDIDPTISITDGTITEANANSTLTISLSAPSGKVVDVSYSTIDNTTEAGDYTTTSGQVSFAPNEQTKTINIGIIDDAIDEDNETLQVQLFGAQNASIADAIGEITITDNDAEPTVSIADVSTLSEASLPVALQITLSSASEKAIRVDYATSCISTNCRNGQMAIWFCNCSCIILYKFIISYCLLKILHQLYNFYQY